jgi:hypothetical protein
MAHTGDVNYLHRRGLYRCARCGTVMDNRVHVFPLCPKCRTTTTWIPVTTVRDPAFRRQPARY